MSREVNKIIVEAMAKTPPTLRSQQVVVEVMGLTDGDFSYNAGYSSAFDVLPPGLGLLNMLTKIEVLAPTSLPGKLTVNGTYVEVLGKGSSLAICDKIMPEIMGRGKTENQTSHIVIEVLGEKENLCNGYSY